MEQEAPLVSRKADKMHRRLMACSSALMFFSVVTFVLLLGGGIAYGIFSVEAWNAIIYALKENNDILRRIDAQLPKTP